MTERSILDIEAADRLPAIRFIESSLAGMPRACNRKPHSWRFRVQKIAAAVHGHIL
jgi:hypothetical protein